MHVIHCSCVFGFNQVGYLRFEFNKGSDIDGMDAHDVRQDSVVVRPCLEVQRGHAIG